MKRRYTREVFAEKIDKIKSLMPDAFIGVDVIVGTRGETDEYFEDTRQFLENLNISQLHVFTYSERANTQALKIAYSVNPQEKNAAAKFYIKFPKKKHSNFTLHKSGKPPKYFGKRKKMAD